MNESDSNNLILENISSNIEVQTCDNYSVEDHTYVYKSETNIDNEILDGIDQNILQ